MGIFATAVDYFQRGGVCMWPLLACSLAAIAIGVERYLYYRQAISGTAFVLEFERLLHDFNLVGARELAGQTKGDAAAIAAEILDIPEDMGSRLETIVYEKVDRSIDALEQHLDYLGVVIGLAPMLGLLGTITGMMATFTALHGQMQNTAAVTAGLAEALITTVFGLVIAILGMIIHAFLNSRFKTASLNLDAMANVLTTVIAARGRQV
jgi:biopolymer transport protein ExbB